MSLKTSLKPGLTGAIVAAALACGMVAAGSASASAAHPLGTAGMHPTVHTLAAGAPLSTLETDFGAAYFSFPGNHGGVSGASATFTMPSTWSCQNADDEEWLLPGIWVLNESGELTQQVDVNFNCHEGTLFMADEIQVGKSTDTGTVLVNNGDRIEASLAYTSTATIGTIRDITTGQSVQVVGGFVKRDFTIFIGEAGPTLFGVSKVPTFTSIPFSKVMINGQYVGDQGPTRYSLESDGTTTQIKTGALTGDGDAFTSRFAHN